MKKIYVLLMHTNTIPSKIIKRATGYDYSHVGISLQKECDTIYSFGRKKYNSIINCGFTIEKKDGAFFKKFNKTVCKIYEVNVSNHQFRQVQRILKTMVKNQSLYKYDFLGLILKYWDIPRNVKNKYVCSYFVAHVLEEAKIYKFSKPTSLVRPKDFDNLANFYEIYQGEYLRYF